VKQSGSTWQRETTIETTSSCGGREKPAHRNGRSPLAAALLAAGLLAGTHGYAQQQLADGRNFIDMSLEELSNLEVTSVSRRGEPVSGAAASIFVITADDIRNAGVRRLPEALRLAPNLQVAALNSGQYAISARGFNNTVSNKLLVMIDGRTVYSPLFSGVFWEQQDVMLEDVERIEVISGPGGALWGANAVNGVINIITRPARDTQGSLVSLGGGNRDAGAAVRYGGTLGGDGHFRAYGKLSTIQDTRLVAGGSSMDGWQRGQAGFRADWGTSANSFTLQGDAYGDHSDTRALGGQVRASGMNLLARWGQRRDDGSDMTLQAYYDRTDREDRLLLQEAAEIIDIDFKHALPFGAHRILYGAGYRHARDQSDPGLFFAFIPPSRTLSWTNLYLQDQIRLRDDLELTLGGKLEHNDYTGWEALPSARIAWKLTPSRLVWGALSRSVRAPARLDREIFSPTTPPFLLRGGPGFQSEVVNVAEVGYREQPTRALSYSVTAFHHEYDKLRSAQAVPGGIIIANGFEGSANGVEAWGNLQATPTWRLSGGVTTLNKTIRLKPGAIDPLGPANLGNDPDYQVMLRSSLNVTASQDFDVMVRRVSNLPQPFVRGYTAVDMRYGWRVNRTLEVSLTAQNLFDSGHVEFVAPGGASEIPRSVFVKAQFRM
jgi:iron complex outermembrane receptor protein